MGHQKVGSDFQKEEEVFLPSFPPPGGGQTGSDFSLWERKSEMMDSSLPLCCLHSGQVKEAKLIENGEVHFLVFFFFFDCDIIWV